MSNGYGLAFGVGGGGGVLDFLDFLKGTLPMKKEKEERIFKMSWFGILLHPSKERIRILSFRKSPFKKITSNGGNSLSHKVEKNFHNFYRSK